MCLLSHVTQAWLLKEEKTLHAKKKGVDVAEESGRQTRGLHCSPACFKNGEERRQAHGSMSTAQRKWKRERRKVRRARQKSLTGMKTIKSTL